MANFKLIYQILMMLDSFLDIDEPDYSKLSAETFHTSERRFINIMIMLFEAGYIDGIRVVELYDGNYDIKMIHPCITLKGLEYLEDNTNMKKVYRFMKGLKDIIPGA